MRKLTPDEEAAHAALLGKGSICPGTNQHGPMWERARAALDGLARKKRATVEMTDDGPRYTAVPE